MCICEREEVEGVCVRGGGSNHIKIHFYSSLINPLQDSKRKGGSCEYTLNMQQFQEYNLILDFNSSCLHSFQTRIKTHGMFMLQYPSPCHPSTAGICPNVVMHTG